jgi:hypothetical protein
VISISKEVSFGRLQLANRQSKNVHLLLATLREYLKDHPLPPIAPTLPDMHSSTPSYLSIQGLYRNQFKQDLQDFRVKLQTVLAQVGLPEDAIPDSEVESFVKNTNGVALVKGSSIASRRVVGGELKSSIGKFSTFLRVPIAYPHRRRQLWARRLACHLRHTTSSRIPRCRPVIPFLESMARNRRGILSIRSRQGPVHLDRLDSKGKSINIRSARRGPALRTRDVSDDSRTHC